MRIRMAVPKLRLWHLIGLVATVAAFLATFQFRQETEDEGYHSIRRLRAADVAERTKAAWKLGSLRPPERRAIGPLTETLFDVEPEVRGAACWSLGVILKHDKADPEAPAVMAALARGLGDPAVPARRRFVGTLAMFHPEAKAILPALLELARDGSADIRRESMGLLGSYARESEPARAALFAALGDPDPDVRFFAVNSLGWCARLPSIAPKPLQDTIIDALVRAADDEAPNVRAHAVRTLSGIASRRKSDIPRVLEALNDPAPEVRLAAADNLAWRRPGQPPEALIPALVRALKDPDVPVRRSSAAALGYFGLDAEAALAPLRDASNDPDETVREGMTKAVADIEKAAETFRRRTLPGAIAGLDETEPGARAYAAGQIGKIGPRASQAVPALTRLLADPDAGVRLASAEALGLIGPAALPSLSALAERAGSDGDEGVRNAATAATLSIRGPEARNSVP